MLTDWKSRIAAFMSFVLLFSIIAIQPKQASAAAVPIDLELVQLELSTKRNQVESGEIFTYILGYSFSSVEPDEDFDNYDDLLLTLPLPIGVEYISSFLPMDNSVYLDGITGTVDTGLLLTYKFSKSPKAGDAYQLQANVQYRSYVTPDGYNGGAVQAQISIPSLVDDPLTVEIERDSITSGAIEVVSRASTQWDLNKSVVFPVVTPKLGGLVKYQIDFDNRTAGSIGNLDINNVTLVDKLPANAEYVAGSASDLGVYNALDHTITWSAASLGQAGSFMSVTATVYYSEDILAVTDTVINTVDAFYTPIGQAQKTLQNSVTHGFTDYNLQDGTGIYKRVSNHHQEISPGQTVDFYIGGLRNRTNDNLEAQLPDHPYAAEITDMRPTLLSTGLVVPDMKLVGIMPAKFEGIDTNLDPADDIYWMEYTLDDGVTWIGKTPVNAINPTYIDLLPMGNGMTGQGVDGVRFLFDGPLPLSFWQASEFKMTYLLDEAYAAVNGENILNKVNWGFGFPQTAPAKNWHTGEDSAGVFLHNDRPLVSLSKKVVGDVTRHLPGDTVEYEMTITNSSRSSSDFFNPIVTDVLPKGLSYVPNSWTLHDTDGVGLVQNGLLSVADDSQLRAETYTYNGNVYADDYRLIKAEYSGKLEPNESFKVTFKARVDDYVVGNFRNRAEVTSNNHNYINDYNFVMGPNPAEDIYDHDGDGSIADQIIYSIADITVNQIAYVQSKKFVRGELDVTDWSNANQGWSSMATTTPGGRVEYRLNVKNEGNVYVDDVLVIDVLPKVDDQGVNTSQSRGSKWSTVLNGPVVIDADMNDDGTDDFDVAQIKTYYSTETNVKMTMAGSPIWSLTPPADLTTVTALKFEFGTIKILPGEELSFSWQMRAPVDAKVNEIAWNSFAHKSQPDSLPMLTSAEPAKVGVKVKANTTKGEIGNYVWADVNRDGIRNDVVAWDPMLLGLKHPYGPDGIPGINGVRVELLDENNIVLQSTVTSDDILGNPGYYLFTSLDVDSDHGTDYKVKFYLPNDNLNPVGFAEWGFEGWTVKGTDIDPLNPDDDDSNVGGAAVGDSSPSMVTDDITLTTAQKIRHDIDAGLIIRNSELGDYIWLDSDWDGIQDEALSLGQNGIGVELYKYVGGLYVLQESTITGNYPAGHANAGQPGYYNFDDVQTGTYKVKFIPPAGHILTQAEQGLDSGMDSNVGTSIGTNIEDALSTLLLMTEPIWVGLGEEPDYTIDAGLINITDQAYSVGDYVWVDYDNDGIQEVPTDPMDPMYGKEIGINDVTVRLFKDGDPTALASTTTKNHPAGHPKEGEPGYYLFEYLQAGDYSIEFVLPTGYMFAKKYAGGATNTSGANDSDLNLGTFDSQQTSKRASTDTFALGGVHVYLHVDAGVVPLASIGDVVWMDYNKNGEQDYNVVTNPREIGIANVPVKLYKAADSLVATAPDTAAPTPFATTTTNSSGKYKFDNLEPDINYIIEFDFPQTANPTSYQTSFPGYPGYERTAQNNPLAVTSATDSDADPVTGLTSIIRPLPDEDVVTVDAGLIEYASIGDYVWIDMNEDGKQGDLLDLDGNGSASDDSGLNGVTVHLLDEHGAPIMKSGVAVKTVTANHPIGGKQGFYLFSHLEYDRSYSVKFEYPDALTMGFDAPFRGWTTKGLVATDGDDSNVPANPSGDVVSDVVLLGVGEHNITIDAGLKPPLGKIGDYVWLDEDWDGQQDIGTELGVNGVTVKLLNNSNAPILDGGGLAITVTTATYAGNDGYYEFNNLQPGRYKVEFSTPSAPKRGFTVKGGTASSNTDSNVNTATARTDTINLGLGKFNMTLDAGIIGYATIGDTVWLDYNEDGVYNYDAVLNPKELGLKDVTVRLYKAADTNVATAPVINSASAHRTTTTDASGNYEFTDLQPGYNYVVEFVKPDGYRFTTQSGVAPNVTDHDSDAIAATGLTGLVRPILDDEIVKVDAGLIELASIGNYVWVDMNKNGEQDDDWIDWNGNGVRDASVVVNGKTLDENESGLNGITVNLYRTSDLVTPIDTMVTINDGAGNPGYYLFTDLDPGTYQVEFVKPADGEYGTNVSFPGWTTKGTGTLPTSADDDSNAHVTTGKSDNITVLMGDRNPTIDAGLLPPVAKLGDFVWLDADWDGTQDGTEAGVDGVTVKLMTTTGATVTDLDNAVVANVISGSNGTPGYYEFTNLKPGQYVVEFVVPASPVREFTTKGTTATSGTDSNVNASGVNKGKTDTITLKVGESNMTIDAGIKGFASIGDTVWLDHDENDLFNYDLSSNPLEVGVKDIVVNLYKAAAGTPTVAPAIIPANLHLTTTTDVDGKYKFDGLQPDYKYIVEFEKPDGYRFTTAAGVLPAAAGNDSDANAVTGLTGEILALIDDDIIETDAGLIKLASIGNYVWIDMNKNGIQDDVWIDWNGNGVVDASVVVNGKTLDENESGLNGITVNLYRPDDVGFIRTTVTANNSVTGKPGYYIFTDLETGDYVVEFVKPVDGDYGSNVSFPGWTTKLGLSGTTSGDSDLDSNVNPATARTDVITVPMGDLNLTIDAGLQPPVGKLGNYVWLDENWDGVQDATELGVNDVTVKLLNSDGTAAVDVNGDPITTALTADDLGGNAGYYEFTNLKPGQYKVEFDIPASPKRLFTVKGAVSTSDTDSNVNVPVAPDDLTIGETDVFNLGLGMSNMTLDAGLKPYASIANQVWLDHDLSGTYNYHATTNPDEIGVAGVTVRLYKAVDNNIATVPVVNAASPHQTKVTDGSGHYLFDDLQPGYNYTVEFVMPDGYRFTSKAVALPAITDNDSDANTTNGQTELIRPGSDQQLVTVDAGLVRLATIGNYVWVDMNKNGEQDDDWIDWNGNGVKDASVVVNGKTLDENESGLNGITVNLYKASDLAAVIQSTDTINDGLGKPGYYLFTDLDPGTYVVEFVKPADGEYGTNVTFPGWTTKGTGTLSTSPDDDSNAHVTTGRSDNITVIMGVQNLTIDAGLLPPVGKLGNYVWLDENWDGVQDAAELGVNGVTVKLFNSDGITAAVDINGDPITAALTADDLGGNAGYYEFTNLKPGQYKVEFELPAGDKRWFTEKGLLSTADSDSNVNVPVDKTATSAQTDVINLPVGSTNMTIDAGLIPYATIGNLVWLDYDGNGTYNYDATTNPDEVGIDNVTVKLYKSATPADAPITDLLDPDYTVTTVLTNASGLYVFEDLQPNYNYMVEFELPTGYTFTTASLVGPVAADHDSDATDIQSTYARTGVIKPAIDEDIIRVDAGLYTVASIGNYVWVDMDRDGTTAGDIGIDWNGDGILNGIDWNSDTVVDNVVWMDFNNDTIVDLGELVDETKVGLNGITVNLYKEATPSVVYKTDITKDDPALPGNPGYYIFEDLAPGKYIVEFVVPATGVYGTGVSFPGFTNKGTSGTLPTDSDVDSNANVLTSRSDVITVFSNEFNKTIDAGLLPPVGKLGDRVWYDIDWNGTQDGGELGVAGVTVNLLDGSGNPVMSAGAPRSVITAADGLYEFDALPSGQYIVEFILPSGASDPLRRFTTKGSGGASDSNVNVPVAPATLTTGRTDVIHLSLGESNPTVDAGVKQITAIGDKVWMDKVVNGVQDASELGVPNVPVKLYLTTNLVNEILSTTTNASGIYIFDELNPNLNYVVEFVLPPGYVFTARDGLLPMASIVDSDADADSASATFGRTGVITPPSGSRVVSVDAGLIELVDLGNYVWLDLNGDGIQDAGEPGINSVTVELYDATDPDNLVLISSQATANNGVLDGHYLFTDLMPGKYVVEFEQPAAYPDYLFTWRYAGADTEDDSNASTNGRSEVITLIAGEDNLTVDGGITEPASVGDIVWIDSNGDGVQDPTELGMNDVKVILYDEFGVKQDEMLTQNHPTTNDPGYYLFDELLPGIYKIEIEVPGGYYVTKKGTGVRIDLDSDIGLAGDTDWITLAPGENNMDVDAGIVLLPSGLFSFASLGDYVWIDANRDGVQDAGELGLNGVIVELYNENSALIATTSTADKDGLSGYYEFIELVPAHEYSVRFILPRGYGFTNMGGHSNLDLDSNADSDGATEAVTLWAGEINRSIDAGLIKYNPGSIGNYVWYDKNEDGLQNEGESGINYVTVQLYDNTGRLVQSLMTAADRDGKPGYYLFTDVAPGTYQIKFIIPTGFKFTNANGGNDHELDSNAGLDGSTTSIVLAEGETNLTIDAGIVLAPELGVPVDRIMEQLELLEDDQIPSGIPNVADNEGHKDNQSDNGQIKNNENNSKANANTGMKNQTGELPKTGEPAPVLPWLGVILMASAGVLWWRRKLKKTVM